MSQKLFKKIVSVLRKRKYDAFLVRDPSNVRYLTGAGFHSSTLITPASVEIFIGPLYYREALAFFKGQDLKITEVKEDFYKFLSRSLKREKVKNLLLDGTELKYSTYQKIRTMTDDLNIKLDSDLLILQQMRAVKSALEIRLMRRALNISLQAFDFLSEIDLAGRTEKSIRIVLEAFLKNNADLELAFDPIVAADKNIPMPHYSKCSSIVNDRSVILIDQGCKIDGYCSDLTRMFSGQEVPLLFSKIADTVTKAREKAIKVIKPGIRASVVDKAARDIIEKAGYGKYFVHSTGHGIGLDVHEYPSLSPNSDTILEPGMVVTVEPGVYLPDKFGFREENMVLVTQNGHCVLDD